MESKVRRSLLTYYIFFGFSLLNFGNILFKGGVLFYASMCCMSECNFPRTFWLNISQSYRTHYPKVIRMLFRCENSETCLHDFLFIKYTKRKVQMTLLSYSVLYGYLCWNNVFHILYGVVFKQLCRYNC